MANFNIPIHSLSVLFLFGSVSMFLWFPDKPYSLDLAQALFYWFVALGIVRWVVNGLTRFCTVDDEGNSQRDLWWWIVEVIAIVFQVGFLIVGIRHFVSAFAKL
jgi:hypothetical protein